MAKKKTLANRRGGKTTLLRAIDLWNLIDPVKATSARPMTESDDLYMNYAVMRIIGSELVVDMSKIGDMLNEIEAMKRGELPYHKTIFSYFGKIPPEVELRE